MCSLAAVLRHEGSLALERRMPKVNDWLLSRGLWMVIDGLKPEKIARAMRDDPELQRRRARPGWRRGIAALGPAGALLMLSGLAVILVSASGEFVGIHWALVFTLLSCGMLLLVFGSAGVDALQSRRASEMLRQELHRVFHRDGRGIAQRYFVSRE